MVRESLLKAELPPSNSAVASLYEGVCTVGHQSKYNNRQQYRAKRLLQKHLQGAIQTLSIARIMPEHNDDQKETNNAEHAA